MLLEKGWIQREQYDRAMVLMARFGETPGYHLVKEGAIADEDLIDFFLRSFALKYWPRYKLKDIPKATIDLIPAKLAKNLRILPLRLKSQNLTIGLTDPSLTHVAEEAAFHTKRFVNPVLITETDMTWALEHYYGITSTIPTPEDQGSSGVKPRATLERETYDFIENPSQYMTAVKDSVAEHKPSKIQVTDEGWGVDDWDNIPIDQDRPIPLTRRAEKKPAHDPAAQPKTEQPRASTLASSSEVEERATLPPPPLKPAETGPRPRPSIQTAPRLSVPSARRPMLAGSGMLSSLPPVEDQDGTVVVDSEAKKVVIDPLALDSKPPFDTNPPPAETTPQKNISEILGAIKASQNRDEIVDLSLDHLLLFARRAAFLIIRKDQIRGFAIKGVGTNRTAIKSYWVPLGAESTFRQVILEGQIHLGPLGRSSSDAVFSAALGGRPHRVLVVPIEIHNRVVGLLYADKLRIEMPPWNLLERLADVMSANLGRLILQKSKS